MLTILIRHFHYRYLFVKNFDIFSKFLFLLELLEHFFQQLARRSVRHYLAPASRQVESRLIKKLNIAASLKRYLTVDGLRQVSRYSKTAKRRKLEDDSDSDINQN